MDTHIDSHSLKRFVRHLCIVTKHHYEREVAKQDLVKHLDKIKKQPKIDKDIELLNQKINLLLDKETKVAQLGIKKHIPPTLAKKIKFLEDELQLVRDERDQLLYDNKDLKEALDSISDLNGNIQKVDKKKEEIAGRVDKIEKKIDERYRIMLIRELKEKIELLGENYSKISKDKTISPNRLFKIEEKLKEYKEKLSKVKKSC